MVDKEKLLERLRATFLEEMDEHVHALNSDLLALGRECPEAERLERLKTLFRTVHSLKGAARAVNIIAIERVCHGLEDLLGEVREEKRPLDHPLIRLLFEAADAFQDAGQRMHSRIALEDGLLPLLEDRIGRFRSGAISSGPTAPLRSEMAPLPELPPRAEVASTDPAEVGGDVERRIRLSAERLDALLSSVSEVRIAQRKLEASLGKLADIQDLVGVWRTHWRALDHLLGGGPRSQGARSPRIERALADSSDAVRRVEADLERLTKSLESDGRTLGRSTDRLAEEVARARMLPFSQACEGLERLVSELAHAEGKQIELTIGGGDLALDRAVIDALKDPLRHLVRNAVDHGLECPAERIERAKSARGRIALQAALSGDRVEVTVADDGAGIDFAALRDHARRRGLGVGEDPEELIRLIFQPGISTAKMITDLSGRGVGLDVVKSRIEALHGSVGLSSEAGHGCRFVLSMPLTLMTLHAVLTRIGGTVFAFASACIERIFRLELGALRSVGGAQVFFREGESVSLVALGRVLGMRAHEPPRTGVSVPVLLMNSGARKIAFVVDEIIGVQDVVVSSLSVRVRKAPHVAGAAMMLNGQIALVLNAAELIQTVQERGGGVGEAVTLGRPIERPRRVLVADDSVTTRSLEKTMLEAAGYEVTAVADGVEAWQALQEKGADLVVSDVEMPRMDGFSLTRAIRESKRFRELPVVLVTALSSDKDRTRGAELGASAYIVKNAFDQQVLLDTVAQLL